MLLSNSYIKQLELNYNGRDFIVGDLHGCYDALNKLLIEVSFQPDIDRLISVGDLIDRGSQSLDCLSLLNKSWFYCVKGNHETMFIDFLNNYPYREIYDLYLLEQIFKRFKKIEQFKYFYLNKLKELPYIIKMQQAEGFIYIVHAEMVDLEKKINCQDIDNLNFSNMNIIEKELTWGRSVYDAYINNNNFMPYDKDVPDIYCGHSILEAPKRIGKQIFLDRGAFVPEVSPKLRFNKRTKISFGDGISFRPGLVLVEPKHKKAWIYETGSGKVKKTTYV